MQSSVEMAKRTAKAAGAIALDYWRRPGVFGFGSCADAGYLAEAGGRLTDVALLNAYDSGHGVASNGHVHQQVLAALDTK